MKLRRGVSINRPGGVVLEGGGNKSSRRFRRVVAANARLSIVLKLVESESDGLPVGLPNLVITANEGRQRDGFRSGKGGIPTCAMLNGCHSPPVFGLIFMDGAVTDQLFAGRRVLAFGKPCELLSAYRS